MFVCPVCNCHTITVYGQNDEAHSAKCNGCGTFDALHKFEAAVITTGDDIRDRDPLAIFPPDDIARCAQQLHHYFAMQRGAKQWKFLNVQSSDAPAVVGIEHIRTMASAFMMRLVPEMSEEPIFNLLCDTFARLQALPDTSDAEGRHNEFRAAAHELHAKIFGEY